MKRQTSKSSTYLFFFIVICILAYVQHGLNTRTKKPKISISKQEEALNFNENFLRLFSFGQARLTSSILWVHTLLESDVEHYKKDDLNSWMYLRFKTISFLDPYFYENYHYGGKYLSIVKDDLLGARDIYERGLDFYPHDFWLRFNNGFNYYFEMGLLKEGIDNFIKIEDHPLVPRHTPYLPTMLARMRAKKGELQLAFDMLLKIYEQTDDQNIFKEKQKRRLYELKAKIDLRCLNAKKSRGCSRKDFLGRPYINQSGSYRAQGYTN